MKKEFIDFIPIYEKEDFIPFLEAGGEQNPEEIRFVYQLYHGDEPAFFSFASPQEFLEQFANDGEKLKYDRINIDDENDVTPSHIEPEDTLRFHMFSYGGEIHEDCTHMYDLAKFAISKSIELTKGKGVSAENGKQTESREQEETQKPSDISQFVYELYKESRMKNIPLIHKYNTMQNYHKACSEEGYNGTLEEYRNKYDDLLYTVMSYDTFMSAVYFDRDRIKKIFDICASEGTQTVFSADKWNEYIWNEYIKDLERYEPVEKESEEDEQERY